MIADNINIHLGCNKVAITKVVKMYSSVLTWHIALGCPDLGRSARLPIYSKVPDKSVYGGNVLIKLASNLLLLLTFQY